MRKPPKLPKNPARDTPQHRRKRLEYLFWLIEDGYPTHKACARAGVSRTIFYNWVNGDAGLMAQYEQTQLILHEKVGEIGKLVALKAFDDPRYQSSLQFYLRCRANWHDGIVGQGQQEMPSIVFKPAPQAAPTDKVDKVKAT